MTISILRVRTMDTETLKGNITMIERGPMTKDYLLQDMILDIILRGKKDHLGTKSSIHLVTNPEVDKLIDHLMILKDLTQDHILVLQEKMISMAQ
jgi:hypothetical protein